jgi:hypothetical protein
MVHAGRSEGALEKECGEKKGISKEIGVLVLPVLLSGAEALVHIEIGLFILANRSPPGLVLIVERRIFEYYCCAVR